METGLKQGQTVNGFEILETKDLGELNAAGIFARHKKSGAEIFHVLNDDEENLFAFTFATAPEDSTGVAHIIEHSVLCGSGRYPLKDPFLVLAQGSLQTYLNAWTYPDKTVYPASSVNERDYFNLMDVYADAVFGPLLSEWTFMQEGHRLELAGDKHGDASNGKKLSVTGVVYNEMKGAYSSLETFANRWAARALLEGTPYAHESGGDPEYIPDLTFEAFKDFHKKRYSPANCRIFLAGNIAPEKQFAFLDGILSAFPAGSPAPVFPLAEKWDKPKKIRVPCPASGGQKAAVLLSWLCGSAADAGETLALTTLSEILMGHDGSPLTKALVESKLGEDLSPASGFEDELRQTVMAAGLRSVDLAKTQAEEVEGLIMGELRRLVQEGIPKEEIDAAIVSLEFSNREICRAQGPFSLVWLQRTLRGWLHGEKPWESLLFLPAFNKIKQNLGIREAQSAGGAPYERYFEDLIQKYLIDNPHRALISVEPESDFLEKKEAALARKLAEKQAALSSAELKDIQKKAKTLEKMQGGKESAEALSAIPHLSRSDLSREIAVVPRGLFDAGGTPVLAHGLFTNGITYVNLAVPADTLDPEDYPWLTLFSRAAVSSGLPGMDYAAVSSLLARTVGAFSANLKSGILTPGSSRAVATPSGIIDLRGRDWLFWNFKCLDEKLHAGINLGLDIITKADFSDLRRLNDIVLNFKNDAASSIAPEGHNYAISRAGRNFSKSLALDEIWNGIVQLEFIRKITAMDTAEISDNLTRIRDKLASAGLLINITASEEAVNAALPLFKEKYACFGAPKPRNGRSAGKEIFFALCADTAELRKSEVWTSPALQVGFAGAVLPASEYASREYVAELVLAHYASTGELWENIRMKGGAYGAFAYVNGLERAFCLASYRDPEPLRTLSAFQSSLEKIGGGIKRRGIDEESLEKAIIGTYAKETHPQTPAQKGISDCLRFLFGIEDAQRSKIRNYLLDISAEELTLSAKRLSAASPESVSCVLEGMVGAEKTAAALGVEAKMLPL